MASDLAREANDEYGSLARRDKLLAEAIDECLYEQIAVFLKNSPNPIVLTWKLILNINLWIF